MSTDLVMVDQSSSMPVLSIKQALDRREQTVAFVKQIMVKGTDYGLIPGTDKDTLLKPGAEKLTTFFGLRPTFEAVERVEDWSGKDHDGEPFFYYWFRCSLLRAGEIVAQGDGSCNSHEKKYRWRGGERVCPKCSKATIRKSKDEYGGGWYCNAKDGGCAAKFAKGDKTIESQETGRVPNPDIADQVNTIQKMAQKRALIAATLIGVNASEYFTQDMEDFAAGEVVESTARVVTPLAQPTNGNAKRTPAPISLAGNGNDGYQDEPPPAPTSDKEFDAIPGATETVAKGSHWIDDEATRKNFWRQASGLRLTEDDVHAAIGSDIHSYAGTAGAALSVLRAYAMEKNKAV